MADHDDVIENEEEQQVNDKHNWGAADLKKVGGADEDTKDVQIKGNLEKLIDGPSQAKKAITLRKEDVQMLVDALEIPKLVAEKELVHHEGDAKAAMRALIGF